jgi:hypothetical protein
MSQTIVEPPLSLTARRFFARMWNDPDSRSILIGLLGVVLVHLLLYLVGPHLLRADPSLAVRRPPAAPRQFSIDLAPDAFVQKVPPPQKLPPKFVETNPNAPDNVPDKTNNFAAQNQQVAQEKPTPQGKSDHPAIEGQKDIHSTQIVTGQLTKPVDQTPIPPAPVVPPKATKITTTRPEENPLSGFEKKIGDDASGYGTNVAKLADDTKNIPQKVDGMKDAPLIEGATAMQPMIDPHRPRPRPQIVKQQQVRPAIFEDNKFGTSNIGNIAVDAKWSNYGVYLQKMIETVQTQWDRLLEDSHIYPPSGSIVTVKFVMNSEGKIAAVLNVDNRATEAAARACVNAITDRSPYGPWTEDMKAMLGEQQEMTFSFYYQ